MKKTEYRCDRCEKRITLNEYNSNKIPWSPRDFNIPDQLHCEFTKINTDINRIAGLEGGDIPMELCTKCYTHVLELWLEHKFKIMKFVTNRDGGMSFKLTDDHP